MLLNKKNTTLTPEETVQVEQTFSRSANKISIRDIYDRINGDARQVLQSSNQVSGASDLVGQKNKLLIDILNRRIDSSHMPTGPIHFLDINQPFDNINEFLTTYHSHTLFYEDTQDSAENFLDLLRMIISLIRKEYNRLDREQGPRTDGSIRFSHAWETTCIMIQEFQCISKESILAVLLHDYFEDVSGPNKIKEQKIRLLLENTQGIDVNKIIDMILKMSKEPLENYLEFPHRLIYSVKNRKNRQAFLDQHKPRLQERQREAYYKSFHDYDIFLIACKCADRLHSLRHFDKNPIDKVQRKLKETKQYFMPVLQNRIKLTNQIEEKHLLEDIYQRMMTQMDICLQVCKLCIERHNDTYDIQLEKEIPGYQVPTIDPKRTLFIPENTGKIKK